MKKILLSKWILNVVVVILWIISIVFVIKLYNSRVDINKKLIEEIEYKDSLNNYNKVYYDAHFNELKKTNKDLYDSLKKYKNEVGYLIQFKYSKDFSTGIVYTRRDTIRDTITHQANKIIEAKTFEYSSEPNDTFQYKLKINSQTEPNWYSLNAKFSDKFTIVNKEDGNGLNHITIGSNTSGDISDVTVFKKKEKRGFWKRFSFGPGATAGYDPINKNFGVVVGATVSYDLSGNGR